MQVPGGRAGFGVMEQRCGRTREAWKSGFESLPTQVVREVMKDSEESSEPWESRGEPQAECELGGPATLGAGRRKGVRTSIGSTIRVSRGTASRRPLPSGGLVSPLCLRPMEDGAVRFDRAVDLHLAWHVAKSKLANGNQRRKRKRRSGSPALDVIVRGVDKTLGVAGFLSALCCPSSWGVRFMLPAEPTAVLCELCAPSDRGPFLALHALPCVLQALLSLPPRPGTCLSGFPARTSPSPAAAVPSESETKVGGPSQPGHSPHPAVVTLDLDGPVMLYSPRSLFQAARQTLPSVNLPLGSGPPSCFAPSICTQASP